MIALLWIISLALAIWGYSHFWAKITAGQVTLSIRINEEMIVEEDVVEIWTVLENRSWMPIPWFEVTHPVPEGLLVQDGEFWRDEIIYRTYLFPRQRVQRRHLVRCEKRGVHRFERAEVQFGDGIGLKDIHDVLLTGAHLIVRPRLLENDQLPVRLNELIGERAVVRWYQEDTSRLQGIRSYQLGDPYKNIHWAATARTGQLMIKQFETTSETDFYVLLNTQFFDPYWLGNIRAVLEQQCRLAATYFRLAADLGYSYGLYTNASWVGVGPLSVPCDRLPGHFDTLYGALGGMIDRANCPFSDVLESLRGRLRSGSTLVIMTGFWNEAIAMEVEHLRGEGHNIVVIAYDKIAGQMRGLSPAVPVIPLIVEDAVAEMFDDGVASLRQGEANIA